MTIVLELAVVDGAIEKSAVGNVFLTFSHQFPELYPEVIRHFSLELGL